MTADAAPVVHPRLGPHRGTRPRTWWGKAWARAVEEAAYAEEDLRAGRALSRAGRVGGVGVRRGGFVAAVDDPAGDGPFPVAGELPVLDVVARRALVETVAAESGRVAALLAGDLPHDVVEHAEEAGVELLPYGGELACSCTCAAWTDPCLHAVAVLDQLTTLIDRDPLVLLHLRGMPREELLARVHETAPARRAASASTASTGGPGGAVDVDVDLGLDIDLALDAVAAARALLREAGAESLDELT